MPENRIGESISKHVWINLRGPAVGSLKEAFLGSSVKVLGVTTQAEDPSRTAEKIKPKTESPTMIVMAGTTSGAQKYIKVQQMYRIVLLGDTRAGKSSLANSMFGEDVFKVDNTECQAESKSVHGRRITLINTPDFSGPGRSEEKLKPEILKCITEFPPGPHAFLIVLNVEKSTEQQQQAVIQKICKYFSEEAFKYAAVVFTQDDQVSEGVKIQDFMNKNTCVSDLVKKCKSGFYTINKYKQQGDNISNQSQVAQLLNTVEQIVKENKGRCYTSKMLPQGGTCSIANGLIKLTGPAAESVAKAFTGPAVVVLTQGTTNEAEESSKTTDEETANRGHTEKTTKEDGKKEETKGGEEAKETEAQKRRDANINKAEQDQQPKEPEEQPEEEATQETEGKKEEKHGVKHEAGQDHHPKETEENAEDRSQDSAKKDKILGHRQAAGGAAAAGAIAAAGGAAAAGAIAAAGSPAATIGAGVRAAASSTATTGVPAAAGSVAGATAAGAGTAGAGGAAGYVANAALATGGVIGLGWVMEKIRNVIMLVKEHIGVVLLVLVFYSLLLSWVFLKVPFVGTLFLLFLLLLLVLILVVI